MSRLQPCTFVGTVNATGVLLIIAAVNSLCEGATRIAALSACLAQFTVVGFAVFVARRATQEDDGR